MDSVDKKPLLLIVDDEPFNLELLESVVERLGYRSVLASDGAEALEKLTPEIRARTCLDCLSQSCTLSRLAEARVCAFALHRISYAASSKELPLPAPRSTRRSATRWRSGLMLKQQKHAHAGGEGRVFFRICQRFAVDSLLSYVGGPS